ncbi:TPA: GIY-YIG nuclease family protein [Photobacterium damselae]
MKNRGTQLKIYLANGLVTGIRHAEIVNWTGQAIAVPRIHIKELSEWEESQRPGVYFLFGKDAETGNNLVYVGEAEHIQKRLLQHLARKEFWNEAICFTNKDENLTKAHVKYLEARLIEIIIRCKRYKLDNEQQTTLPSLPRGERDAMETFIDNIRMMIGSLGHKLLEPQASFFTSNFSDAQENNILYLKVKKIDAKAILTDEGIVVLKGSKALSVIYPSLSQGHKKLRSSLEEKKILTPFGEQFIANEDILFSSASQASSILLGYPTSGLNYWVNISGKTLKEIELG